MTLSLSFPELLDARFSSICQTNEIERIKDLHREYFGTSFSISKHLQYKYQILIDGNTCAYSRAFWQLFSNCLVFKPLSSNIQWYYKSLVPTVHYIPCSADLSDLPEKIKWAQKNDLEAKKIAQNARTLASEILNRSQIYYYLYAALIKYSSIQSK